MATVLRPPIITRIPPPDPGNTAAINSQSFVWSNPIVRLYDNLPKSGRVWYYSNPRGPQHPIYSYEWGNPLLLLLQGTDNNLLGRELHYYPNPRGPLQPLYEYTQGIPYPLRPQPFFGLAGHPNFNQPNPIGPLYPIGLRSWSGTFIFPVVGVPPPNSLRDQPNPRGYQQPISAYTWINQGTVPIYPKPVGTPALCFTSEQAVVTCAASDSPSGQNWSGAGYMAKYEIDTSIRIQSVFFNSLLGVYVDPTEVQLFIMDPAGNILDHTTLDGSVTRSELGHYIFTFEPTVSGTWTYKWQGTGIALATSPDTTFTVNASTLIAG